MKNFNREYTAFALCGLNCGLCPMYHMEKPCPGCGGGEGNQSCAIARCSLEHGGPAHCSQCGEFPCARYEGLTGYDSFLSHRNMLRDLKRAEEMGYAAYRAELEEKMEILRKLLLQYNDGRRKTFFCTAVNPVSYTHLDVYKRQNLRCITLCVSILTLKRNMTAH